MSALRRSFLAVAQKKQLKSQRAVNSIFTLRGIGGAELRHSGGIRVMASIRAVIRPGAATSIMIHLVFYVGGAKTRRLRYLSDSRTARGDISRAGRQVKKKSPKCARQFSTSHTAARGSAR